jgi:hypothetical protein
VVRLDLAAHDGPTNRGAGDLDRSNTTATRIRSATRCDIA